MRTLPPSPAAVRGRWTTAVVTVVWAWIAVPRLLQTVLSPKYRNSVGSDDAPYSRLAAYADRGLYICIILVCGVVVLSFLHDIDTRAIGRLLALLAPWAYIVIRDLYVPTSVQEEAVCYLLVVLALWTLRPDIGRLDVLGYLMGLTAAMSILLALVQPSHAIFQTAAGEVIAEDKQILPWGLLVGIFTQGNNLGQFLALGIPAVFLIRNRTHRFVLVGLTALAIVWSGSRSSMLAVGVGAVAYLAIVLAPKVIRFYTGLACVILPFVAVVVIPLVTTDPLAFTNRGLVWLYSLRAWDVHQWIGNGAAFYTIIGATPDRLAGSVFHGHNQFVQFMVTGGLVFGLLVVPQIVIAATRASRFAVAGQPFGVAWLALLAACCMLEKAFAYVDNINSIPAMVIPFAFVMFGQVSDRPGPDVPLVLPDAAPPASRVVRIIARPNARPLLRRVPLPAAPPARVAVPVPTPVPVAAAPDTGALTSSRRTAPRRG